MAVSAATGMTVADFEGLVQSTTRLNAELVGMEHDDFAQVLRVKIWRVLARYNGERSTLTIERFVFGCVTNKVKDMRRDSKRARNREKGGAVYIEDLRAKPAADAVPTDRFDSQYLVVEHDEVFGRIEEGMFVLPANVTDEEANMLVLVLLDFSQREIALRLSMAPSRVKLLMGRLREKFADWRPSQPGNSSRVVEVEERIAA